MGCGYQRNAETAFGLQIRSLVLCVDLVGSRRIDPAHGAGRSCTVATNLPITSRFAIVYVVLASAIFAAQVGHTVRLMRSRRAE
jgi:hypothetical protein